MATTTMETIRENMETLVNALTPTAHANELFRVERGEHDFRTWAEANPAAAFRRYAIDQTGEVIPGEVTNLDLEEVETEVEMVVAYPKNYGKYGNQNYQDMRDLIDADAMQLRNTIGHKGHGNWVAGQLDAFETHTTESGESVAFLVITLDVRYYRSMT